MATISSNGFDLTLDTLAPSGSIERTKEYCNAQQKLTITVGDAAHYAVWFDTNSTGTLPETPTWQEVSAATTQTTAFVNDGSYYYHMALRDNVGNISEVLNTSIINFDTQNPEVVKVEINGGDQYTNHRDNNTLYFEFKDISKDGYQSGVNGAYYMGDIVGTAHPDAVAYATNTAYEVGKFLSYNSEGYRVSTAITAAENTGFDAIKDKLTKANYVDAGLTAEEIAAGNATRTFAFTTTAADGSQTITVVAYDKAENYANGTDSIYLDTTALEGHITIYDTAGTAKVTPHINYTAVNVHVDANGASDWAKVKCWVTGETEPTVWTDVVLVAEKDYMNFEKTFSTGDGIKYAYAKIMDTAGTETTLDTKSVVLDQTAPTASIALSETHVSKVDGFTTFVCTNTVVEALSGVKEYELRKDGTKLAAYSNNSGSSTSPLTVPATFNMSQADLGEEGTYVLTLWVKDNALNEVTSEGKTIYVDTTAPTGSITPSCGNGGWYGGENVGTGFHKFSTASATASATDGPATTGVAAGMSKMICWADTTANNTTVPSSAIESDYAENPTHAQIDWTGTAESSTNYIHIKYVDKVGNAGFAHSAAFGKDTVLPGQGTITTPDVTATPSITAAIGSTDATSGVAMMKVWGDVNPSTEAAAEWVAYAASKSLSLTGADGTKTVYVRFRDAAGNVSADPASYDTTELDTTAPTAQLVLVETDDTTKKSPTNKCEFKARISGTDDETTGEPVLYMLYGDFNYNAQGTSGTAKGTWIDFPKYETGKTYALTETLYCTKNDGEQEVEKEVYLYVQDNAGNVYPHKEGKPTEMADSGVKQSFIYDTKAPVVVVSGVDYNRISKVHTARNDNATKFNDETKFTFTPDSEIQAYKVCAYLDATACDAGNSGSETKKYSECTTREEKDAWVALQVAIPITAGSTNMSASGLKSSSAVSAMVRGTDYENALGGITKAGDKDGLHYIVAYVQDLGGTWSVAATITA